MGLFLDSTSSFYMVFKNLPESTQNDSKIEYIMKSPEMNAQNVLPMKFYKQIFLNQDQSVL